MHYSEHKPRAPLDQFIQCITIMESEVNDDRAFSERIVPDGIVEMVFHYGDPLITIKRLNSQSIQPRSFAISQMKDYIEIRQNGSTGYISARFWPWGAYHFFDLPISGFLDETIEIDDLWDDRIRVENEISAVDTKSERISILEGILIRKLAKYHVKSDMDKIICSVRSLGGKVSLQQLRDQTGWTKKTLERRFVHSVGTTPKKFLQTTRFLNTCHEIVKTDTRLVNLGMESGYYDQAHFINDFKRFSGYSPREYRMKHSGLPL